MSRLDDVVSKVDAFFARVTDRHGEDMQCGTGCSDCCHVRLTVTSVEADAIRAELARWPLARKIQLGLNVAAAPADRCAALDADGRCLIYDARPVVCRSHGAPIRMRRGSLPVIESCHRNFTHVVPDADCVLDQETLSTMVLAVDRAEGRDGARLDLASVLVTE